MKLTSLPLDTWVVVEPTVGDEVKLLSKHKTQCQAEAECDARNKGLRKPRYHALKALAPVAGALGCAAAHQREHRS
jgi:hypothetical protein